MSQLDTYIFFLFCGFYIPLYKSFSTWGKVIMRIKKNWTNSKSTDKYISVYMIWYSPLICQLNVKPKIRARKIWLHLIPNSVVNINYSQCSPSMHKLTFRLKLKSRKESTFSYLKYVSSYFKYVIIRDIK